jgi:hypothetical protein
LFCNKAGPSACPPPAGRLLARRAVDENPAWFLLVDELVNRGVLRQPKRGVQVPRINGILSALEEYADKLEFVQVRHEEMAAFMACAHAKFTGEVGSA